MRPKMRRARLVDLATPLTADTRLELINEKDPEALKVVRHSAAHVLATAVLELFPRPSSATVRPRTRVSFTTSIVRSPSHRKIWPPFRRRWPRLSRATKICHEYEPREQALAEFERDGDFMKTHFVTKFTEPGSEVSFYRNGKFVDFCRGPHVPSTGRVKAFKVLRWPALTGSATKRIRSCSAFMARHSSRRRNSMPSCAA